MNIDKIKSALNTIINPGNRGRDLPDFMDMYGWLKESREELQYIKDVAREALEELNNDK